ncbi:MAG: GNAT family N-acetyltransferase [Acidobacteriota bacterium]
MLSKLAALLPDLPRLVETRGMLLSGRSELLEAPGPGPVDFIARGTDFGLICVSGNPALPGLEAAARRFGATAVLCAADASESLAAALPGWTRARAVIHSRRGGGVSAGPSDSSTARVEMLSGRDAASLSHVPEPLREEISTALGFSHVAAAFVEQRPVSFCYAVYETEGLWDISIDTLEAHRGKGLARACCEFLIEHMSRHGKEPVWGALEENVASRTMAKSLGFAPVDELAVFRRAEP